jgi:hypothetical protein
MPPFSDLSALAAPFVPTRVGYQDGASFAAIYNDGIPEGVVYGNHADHEIIHNIPDETLDEIFPPSAYDAAELDAADEFLNQMVDLSFLEEREERTRSDYGYHFKMRWEARRQQGLTGKPVKLDPSIQVRHGHNIKKPIERSLVHYHRHRRDNGNIENRQHRVGASKYGRNHFNARCRSRPIQQPRKMN